VGFREWGGDAERELLIYIVYLGHPLIIQNIPTTKGWQLIGMAGRGADAMLTTNRTGDGGIIFYRRQNGLCCKTPRVSPGFYTNRTYGMC